MTHPLRKHPRRNCSSNVEQVCREDTRQALIVAHCQQTQSWALRAGMNMSRL
jgi:hypothetical protein